MMTREGSRARSSRAWLIAVALVAATVVGVGLVTVRMSHATSAAVAAAHCRDVRSLTPTLFAIADVKGRGTRSHMVQQRRFVTFAAARIADVPAGGGVSEASRNAYRAYAATLLEARESMGSLDTVAEGRRKVGATGPVAEAIQDWCQQYAPAA